MIPFLIFLFNYLVIWIMLPVSCVVCQCPSLNYFSALIIFPCCHLSRICCQSINSANVLGLSSTVCSQDRFTHITTILWNIQHCTLHYNMPFSLAISLLKTSCAYGLNCLLEHRDLDLQPSLPIRSLRAIDWSESCCEAK